MDFHDPDKPVTFTKDSEVPEHINNVKFSSFKPPKDWSKVEGQNHDIDEPPLPKTKKKLASGLIMHEPDGRVWLAKPANEFGGYKHTFPKGGLEKSLHPQANAIKETHEETGLHGRVTGFAGDHEGDTSMTRYYHAERIGGHPHDHGWESEAVVLSPKAKLHSFLNKDRDRKIADSLEETTRMRPKRLLRILESVSNDQVISSQDRDISIYRKQLTKQPNHPLHAEIKSHIDKAEHHLNLANTAHKNGKVKDGAIEKHPDFQRSDRMLNKVHKFLAIKGAPTKGTLDEASDYYSSKDKIPHHVINSKTGHIVGKASSLFHARRVKDRKDNEYGAYVHRVVRADTGKSAL